MRRSSVTRGPRAFVADTTAMLIFFTAIGVLNERFVASMTWDQIWRARLLGAVLMVPVAYIYGLWRDWLMKQAKPRAVSRLFWDSVALVSFQAPIYAGIIAVNGASGWDLLFGIGGAAVLMLVSGRAYGVFLDRVRRMFGVTPK